MKINYFELKYRILDVFYDTWLVEERKIEEAVGFTYYTILGGRRSEDNIETLITRITVMQLYSKHSGKQNVYNKEELKELLDIYCEEEAKLRLTEDEFEYFDEDMGFLLSLYK